MKALNINLSRWALLFSFMFFASILSCQGIAHAEEQTVNMELWEFHPPELTIQAGDTVVWKNIDDTMHNLVFIDEVAEAPTKEEPKKIKVGRNFSLKFDKVGEYNYYCKNHRGQDMIGKIIVKE